MKSIAAAGLLWSVLLLSGCENQAAGPMAPDPAQPENNVDIPGMAPPVANQQAPVQQESSLASKIAKSRQNMTETLQSSKKTPQIATVIVKGVPGDPEDAARFLYGIISKESGRVSQEDQNRAREQTKQNFAQAEAEARQKYINGTGGILFEYRLAEDQYGYAYTWNVGREGNTFAFVTHPAPDLNALGQGLARLGKVVATDNSGRQITIQANIPTPIPDLAVEYAVEAHGPLGYAILEIRNAPGVEEDVEYYLEGLLKKFKGVPEKTLTVGYLKRLSSDGYRFLMYPVESDLQLISDQIDFGNVVGKVDAARTILVTANLPESIPKKPSREELWKLEEEERKNRPSPWDESPKKGEDRIDWVIRILKNGTSSSRPFAYQSLANDEVVDERRADVMQLLIQQAISDPWFADNKDIRTIVERWKTPELEETLVAAVTNQDNWARRPNLILLLEAHGTETAARGIATCLTDFHSKDEAFESLKRMGLAAEPVFIEFLENSNPQARLESTQLLGQFGMERSLKALEKQLKTERVKDVKSAIRFAIDRIKTRIAEQSPATETKSES